MIPRRAITQAHLYWQSVASLHSSSILRADSKSHTTDSYSKDLDLNPPQDSKIHRVDPSSESSQKPHEPPTGPWSQAGVKTKEYEAVSTTEPYKAHGQGEDTRYGGKKETGPEISKPEEGPNGTSKGGRT